MLSPGIFGVDVQQASALPETPGSASEPPAPGEYWVGQGGRFICTLPALAGLPARHLIVGEGEADDLTFGPSVEVPGAGSHADGVANTAALLAHSGTHPAVKWASEYSADGHADFHLPSRLDLLLAYINAPQLFKKSGWYWSSTQGSRYSAFVQDFENGLSGWIGKDVEHRVRAVRWIRLDTLNA
ncbi:DUF1566 domain-containing protein [Variovorax sp. 2RAF20]